MSVTLKLELEQNGVLTSESFSIEVERRYLCDPDPDRMMLSHASEYMEELSIDPEEGTSLISPSLMDKIRNEALTRNMLKEKRTTFSLF